MSICGGVEGGAEGGAEGWGLGSIVRVSLEPHDTVGRSMVGRFVRVEHFSSVSTDGIGGGTERELSCSSYFSWSFSSAS